MATVKAAPEPDVVSFKPGALATEEQHAKYFQYWSKVFAGADEAKAWRFVSGVMRNNSTLAGIVSEQTTMALDGEPGVDSVLALQTLAWIEFPAEVIGDMKTSYQGDPMAWMAAHSAKMFRHLKGCVTITPATMAASTRSVTADEVFAEAPGKVARHAFLTSDLHGECMAALADPSTAPERWSELFSGRRLSLDKRTLMFGLRGFKPKATGGSSKYDDKDGTPEKLWYDLLAQMTVAVREALRAVLDDKGGVHRVLTSNVVKVQKMVMQADLQSMFGDQLYMFSKKKRIREAGKAAAELSVDNFHECVRGAVSAMRVVYGVKIGDGAEEIVVRWTDSFNDLNPGCLAYPGGLMGIFKSIPLYFMQQAMDSLAEELVSGKMTAEPWATKLGREELFAASPSKVRMYLRNLEFMDHEEGEGRRTDFSSEWELQDAINGVHSRPGAGRGSKRERSDNMCHDFQKGKCNRGSGCRFQHGGAPSPQQQQQQRQRGGGGGDGGAGGTLQSDRPCFDFQKGSCTRGAACKFSHDAAGAGKGRQGTSNVPCRDFKKGDCKHGAKCKFSHGGKQPAGAAQKGKASAFDQALKVLNAAIGKSGKPKACVHCSFGGRTCSHGSVDRCSQRVGRQTSHDAADQLTYGEQKFLLSNNKNIRDSLLEGPASAAMKRIFQFKMLDEAKKM